VNIVKYYNRSKRKWIVEVRDNASHTHVAESYFCDNKQLADEQEEKVCQKYGYAWFFHWTTEKIIKEILTEHGIDCGVKNVVNRQRKIMFYNYVENNIGFNNDYIVEFCMNNLIPIIEGVKCITYHEIGHWLEFTLYPELAERARSLNEETQADFKVEREETAFKLARYLVPEDLLLLYDDINNTNLRNYEKKYNGLTM
jgi:hypothetical protein